MEKVREFGVLKWLVFPSMSLTLAAIVAWFNLTVFGWKDGAFYIVAVVIIAAFSIAINKYVGSASSRLAVAAFVFEIILILALGANAIYSLSVQREMAVARQAEQTNVEAIREIKQLKSRQAQRDATRMVAADRKGGKSSQAIFAENERMLLWLMAGEMLAYIVSAFSLYALSHLPRREASAIAQPQPGQAGYLADRTFRVRADGSREIIQSTYSADEIGRVIPPGVKTPSHRIRQPLVRPSSPSKAGEQRGNGADPQPSRQHINSGGILD